MIKQGKTVSFALFPSLLLVLTFAAMSGCTHSMDKAENSPQEASIPKTEAIIKQSWHGDYPVKELALLPEKTDQEGSGYLGDAHTFKAVWSVFKPGDPAPEVDFKENLVIFVRNIQYYNRIRIGSVVLEDGVAKVMAMETLSARQIEDVVALSMALISREGVTGIQARGGVLQVAK